MNKYLEKIGEFTLADLSLSKKDFVKWIAALRSGNYSQCDTKLHIDDSYCCLGVLCDVTLVSNGDAKWEVLDDGESKYWILSPLNKSFPRPAFTHLPKGFAFGDDDEKGGLMDILSSANDLGATFKEIADALESHFLPMFEMEQVNG